MDSITTEVTEPSNSKPLDLDACTALYVELRDAKAAMKAELVEKLKPYNEGLEQLEGLMLKALQDQNAKSVKTIHGTVFQKIERSATIKDKKAFREFIVGNKLFDMLDWKANKVQVFDYIEKESADVPGVNTSAFMTVGVLRGEATSSED